MSPPVNPAPEGKDEGSQEEAGLGGQLKVQLREPASTDRDKQGKKTTQINRGPQHVCAHRCRHTKHTHTHKKKNKNLYCLKTVLYLAESH